MDTEPVADGDLSAKWRRVEVGLTRDFQAMAECHANGPCSAAAQRLLDLSAEGAGRNGRARVGLINRAVDLAIAPATDEALWGVPDHWSDPLETLQSGRGDCEDYAIVKYVALLEAGFSRNDVKIIVLKNLFPDEDHAAVAVRVDGQWLILDNRTLTLVQDTDVTRTIPSVRARPDRRQALCPGGPKSASGQLTVAALRSALTLALPLSLPRCARAWRACRDASRRAAPARSSPRS